MKVFERFITYLCITGVIFAVFYSLLPGIAAIVVDGYGPIFGPIIVVGLFALAWFKKPKEAAK